MPNKPQAPGQILKKDSDFQGLFQRIEIHNELLRRVKEALPELLAKHCQYCVVKEDGGLIIFSDSQAFASQLRFYAPIVLAKLNADRETPFKQISARNLNPEPPAKVIEPMKPASREVIEIVKASSKSAPNDELAKALARLATTMENYAKGKT
jgi:hypothetical protein